MPLSWDSQILSIFLVDQTGLSKCLSLGMSSKSDPGLGPLLINREILSALWLAESYIDSEINEEGSCLVLAAHTERCEFSFEATAG